MSRYIDADKAIKQLDQSIKNLRLILPASHFFQVKQDIEAYISFLRNQPTADERENVKGEWVDCLEDDIIDVQICSVCGYKEYVTDKPNFCPNCGAKMDMRGEENAE